MPEYLDPATAAARLCAAAEEFVLLENPPGHFPPHDILPLGPRFHRFDGQPVAILVDMDGTTTSTEDLCLYALENLVRQFTGWHDKQDWPGLDPDRDYPHIIGTSCTANVQYLAGLYAEAFEPVRAARAFLESTAWTLTHCVIPGRDHEVRTDLRAMGLANITHEAAFAALCSTLSTGGVPDPPLVDIVAAVLARASREDWIRAGLSVYHHVMHSLMQRVGAGETRAVAEELYGPGHERAIEPFPGIAALFALARGWLAEEAAALHPILLDALPATQRPLARDAAAFGALGAAFHRSPARVGLVTSSAGPEADFILHEVFQGMREEVATWPIAAHRRDQILAGFAAPRAFYDCYITASDCHEMRLKPHRDLYSVALHQLGITAGGRARVIGLEDTEAGILAQRAAGVGLPIAVPFHGTRNHPFQAAAHVCMGGVPEALLVHGLFVS